MVGTLPPTNTEERNQRKTAIVGDLVVWFGVDVYGLFLSCPKDLGIKGLHFRTFTRNGETKRSGGYTTQGGCFLSWYPFCRGVKGKPKEKYPLFFLLGGGGVGGLVVWIGFVWFALDLWFGGSGWWFAGVPGWLSIYPAIQHSMGGDHQFALTPGLQSHQKSKPEIWIPKAPHHGELVPPLR